MFCCHHYITYLQEMSRSEPVLVRKQDLPDCKPDWCKMSAESFEEIKVAAVGEPVPDEYSSHEELIVASGKFKSAADCWLMQCLQG